MLIYSIWHLSWFWIELYQAVIWFCYRNKYTVGMYSCESETYKENLELGLKPRWLSTLKVKEFSTVFKIYYHFAPFSYNCPPYRYCATSYYFNNLYSCQMYHNNIAQVECVLMKEYAVSLLVCIRPLCWAAWSQRVHVEDPYYQLVRASPHLSLAARVWRVYRRTALAVSSAMRQCKGCVLAPWSSQIPRYWLTSQFLMVWYWPSVFLSD